LLSNLDFAASNGWLDRAGKRDAGQLLLALDQQVGRDYEDVELVRTAAYPSSPQTDGVRPTGCPSALTDA
jgi:hypothetical protein